MKQLLFIGCLSGLFFSCQKQSASFTSAGNEETEIPASKAGNPKQVVFENMTYDEFANKWNSEEGRAELEAKGVHSEIVY